MRHLVKTVDDLPEILHVAGVTVRFDERDHIARAAAVVLTFPDLRRVDQALARRPLEFPYIPGLLSFRELPAVLDALALLHIMPDLILCSGHGFAHPRRFGIACHLGVLFDRPTIGVAKTHLVGRHIEPACEKGSWAPLQDGDEVVGAALRTRTGVKPVYVSIGHRLTLETAIRLVIGCTTRYRLPETLREAHKLASRP